MRVGATVVHGDSLEVMSSIGSDTIDLVYADPPFHTGRDFGRFNDRWASMSEYLGWMKPRLAEMRRVLKPTGTMYLHCDTHANHHLRVLLDDVFGPDRFLNEIIWHYQTSGGAPKKTLIRNHDTIYRYSKSPAKGVTWNAPLEPWPESTLDKWQRDEDGRIYHVHNDTGVRYFINPDGKLMDDVWHITFAARSRERLGWPTQKPEVLLRRIIEVSTNVDDLVLDPFCGSGTTLIAAAQLGRRSLGIDVSVEAVALTSRRLEGTVTP